VFLPPGGHACGRRDPRLSLPPGAVIPVNAGIQGCPCRLGAVIPAGAGIQGCPCRLGAVIPADAGIQGCLCRPGAVIPADAGIHPRLPASVTLAKRNRTLLAVTDDNSTRQLVVPTLFPWVKGDPYKPQAQQNSGNVIRKVAADVLSRGRLSAGLGIHDFCLDKHFPRRGLFVNPKQDNYGSGQYNCGEEIRRAG